MYRLGLLNWRSWYRNDRNRGLNRLLDRRCVLNGSVCVSFLTWLIFHGVFFQEAEDVVENEVTARLLREEESLNKLLPWLAPVAHLTDHLNYNPTRCRGLSINRVNKNLAILETDGENFIMDFL